MQITFRQRILFVLIALGALPTAVAIVGWALSLQSANPGSAGRAVVEQVAGSGRVLLETLDTTRLRAEERQALAAHAAELNDALSRSQAAHAYSSYYTAGLTVALLTLGALLVYASVRLGGHLSRQLSRPIDELVGWTGHILRHEPLPEAATRRGAPEFAALRTALREMAAGLEQGRAREVEAARLRAFQEMARRAAHEMKNPLTPIRFAVAQLERTALPAQRDALEVLAAEATRLEQLAREFTELGRLPEGPAALVDVGELVTELSRTVLPPAMTVELAVDPAAPCVRGHYDPLRRAFSNILRNAVEASGGAGRLGVVVAAEGTDGVRVEVADRGPGIPTSDRERVFEPYFTTKPAGTGLGLALVRQTVEAHGGSVAVTETEGGGATLRVRLPGA